MRIIGLLLLTVLATVCIIYAIGCDSAPTAVSNETGSLTVSIGPEVSLRALSDRFVFDDVLVQCRKASDDSVLREAVLTVANPTTTMAGLPAGTVCYVYAAARRSGVTFTSGQSANVTIVAGSNVNATVTLAATNPTFSNVSPANGSPVNSSNVTVSATVTDQGGKVPTTTIVVNGTTHGPFTSATPSVSLTGLADGPYSVSMTATTPSGGTTTTTSTFTVDTTGGITIGIESVGG